MTDVALPPAELAIDTAKQSDIVAMLAGTDKTDNGALKEGVVGPPTKGSNDLGLPPQKMLPPLQRSSSTFEPESDTPPPAHAVKMFVLPKSDQEHPQPQGRPSAGQPVEIQRMGSTAESLVDSWSPDLTRVKSTPNPYDTAPYCGSTEEPTVRLARPASKRGNLPSFAELAEAAGCPEAAGLSEAESEVVEAKPSAGILDRQATLSPIHSKTNSAIDLSIPISLDDLRDGAGVFDTNPYNVEPAVAAIVPVDDAPSESGTESEESSVTHETSDIERSPSNTVTEAASTATASVNSSLRTVPDDMTESLEEPIVEQTMVESSPMVAADSAETETAKKNRFVSDPFTYDPSISKKMRPDLASPVLSTKSMKSPLGSPALSALSNGVVITDNRISMNANNATLWATAAAAAHARSSSNFSLAGELRSMSIASSKDPEIENISRLRHALQMVGLFKNTAKVAPGRRPPPAPDSNALPELPPSGNQGSGDPSSTPLEVSKPGFLSATPSVVPTPAKPDLTDPEKQAPFADGFLGKTPLVSPTGTGTDEDTADDTSSMASSSPGGLAKARVEVEGDVEEGGVPATDGGAGVAVATDTASSARVATSGSVQVAAADSQMVLPCAPSDDEKIMYYKTGRFGMITAALLSFYTLSVGMWLFTIVTPAFYWFGVPAVFLMFYLVCHYFGVALWGTDFRPGVHENILRRSREAGYQPTVDVFLPVCKEPVCLLANTWKYVSELEYPNITVHVLDDGASDEVRDLAAEFGFNYIVRPNRPELKKAGNLRYAFSQTSGEAIAIFDADFCPRPDFLSETIPYFGQMPSVGILQTPQFFRYREEQTWIEKGAGVTQEFFYRLVQVNQDKFNAAVCVGSCGLYRRAALEPFGGMAAIAHSEDMYTGYKMTEYGYSIKYLPLPLAMGACPDDPQTFFMQQYRWCMGSATLVMEKEFWKSNISNIHKLCFLNGMLYYFATALLVFLAPVPILLLVWMRASGVLWYHSIFAVPSIIFASVVMPCWSKQKYGMACHRVKIIQCYAHMFAIKDRLMGRSAPWVPSGVGKSSASVTYKCSVRLLIIWNVVSTALIVGGSAWRMTDHTYYHFIPAIVLAAGSFILNMSTLVY